MQKKVNNECRPSFYSPAFNKMCFIAPFTLFGGDNDDDEPMQKQKPLFSKADDNIAPDFTPKKAQGRLGLGVLFFFHFDEPSLVNK